MKKAFKIRKILKNGKDKLRPAKHLIARAVRNTTNKISHAPYQVGHYLKENPMKSVGITVIASVLLSQLLRLRHLNK